MKRLAILLATVLFSFPCFAQISVVQSNAKACGTGGTACTGSGSTLQIPLSSTGSGNFLFVADQERGASAAGLTPTDGGDTFTRLEGPSCGQDAVFNNCYEAWYTCSTVGGSTGVTLTGVNTDDGMTGAVIEVKNLPTSLCLDQTATVASCAGGCGNPVSSNNLTSLFANELLLGIFEGFNSTCSPTSSPYTNAPSGSACVTVSSGFNLSIDLAYEIVSSTGTYHNTWTFGASTGSYHAFNFSFGPQASGRVRHWSSVY